MYREDDKPWRYLNVPGAPQRQISPRKVMRRMSLTATGHVVERMGLTAGGGLAKSDEIKHQGTPSIGEFLNRMTTTPTTATTATTAATAAAPFVVPVYVPPLVAPTLLELVQDVKEDDADS